MISITKQQMNTIAFNSEQNLLIARKGYVGLSILAFIFQLIVYASPLNFGSSCLVLISSISTAYYLFRPEVMGRYPISSLQIFLFQFVSTGGALILKMLELGDLTDGLELPLETFGLLTLALLVFIATHLFYRNIFFLQGLRNSISNVYNALDAFTIPSENQLWFMGLIGYGASLSLLDSGDSQDVSLKFTQGFIFLRYAPFIIPFIQKNASKNQNTLIICYFMALVALGLLTNARATFADVFLMVGLSLFFVAMQGQIKLTRKMFYRFVMSLFVLLPLLKIVSVLGTAMVIARDIRADVTAIELLSNTLAIALDNEAIESYKKIAAGAIDSEKYNEKYFDNIFFSRLIFTKFHDNILYYSQYLSFDDKTIILNGLWDKIVNILPCPISELMQLGCNKEYSRLSAGDLFNFQSGALTFIGGYTVGSWIVEIFSLFDVFFIGIYFIFALFVFVFFDAFSIVTKNKRLVISNIFYMNIYFLAGGMGNILNNDSSTTIFSAIVRGLPQTFLIYWIALKIAAIIFPTISKQTI